MTWPLVMDPDEGNIYPILKRWVYWKWVKSTNVLEITRSLSNQTGLWAPGITEVQLLRPGETARWRKFVSLDHRNRWSVFEIWNQPESNAPAATTERNHCQTETSTPDHASKRRGKERFRQQSIDQVGDWTTRLYVVQKGCCDVCFHLLLFAWIETEEM